MPTTTLPTCAVEGCTGHLGKFSDCTAEALYGWSTESGQDETIGETDALGWFALFNLAKIDPKEYGDGSPAHTYAAAILSEDSAGRVTVETFHTLASAEARWSRIETMYADFYGVGAE